jgi:hypothetical protein
MRTHARYELQDSTSLEEAADSPLSVGSVGSATGSTAGHLLASRSVSSECESGEQQTSLPAAVSPPSPMEEEVATAMAAQPE